MTRKSHSAAPSRVDPSLTKFTQDFFAVFGATLRRDASQPEEVFEIELTDSLRQHFGRDRLRVAFHTGEVKSDVELIAYGSRIFDQMMALLEQRGAFVLLRAPVKHSGGELLMSAFRPTNASVSRLRLQERTRTLFQFTWRITYRADDKRQEIYTVWLDDDGRLLHQLDLADGNGAHQGSPSQAMVDDYVQLLADAEPAPIERNAAGEVLPPKLPALAQLTRLAERARSYAIYHADVRCVAHEAEILPRLYKALNRLTTYYAQQIGEVQPARDSDGERRRAMEADLNRKVAEEIENHRLRVEVELIGYVAVELPVAVGEMTLTTGHHEVTVRVEQDRYTGIVRRPACHVCGAETAVATIDRNGHLTCERCIHLCAGCNDLLCAICGVSPCPVCAAENCDRCGRMCWACGERACEVHISVCPTCGDDVCHACQTECAACGVRQCKSHLRSDCVAEARGIQELICPRCAVRCPGCQQFSAHMGVCDASGQRFCQNCLVICAGCGKSVGPGYYQFSTADHQPYCNKCLYACPICHALTHEMRTCASCGCSGCSTCIGRCVVCGRDLCAEHSIRMLGCGHVVCNRDLQECGVCHELVCPQCAASCAICGAYHCEEHTTHCTQCGQEYCTGCVSRTRLCATCTVISVGGIPVDRLALSWEDYPAAQALIPHYRWVIGRNRRYDIYVGEGAMMSVAIVVIDREAKTQRFVRVLRLSALDRLRIRLGI